jgi:hypothetical protein
MTGDCIALTVEGEFFCRRQLVLVSDWQRALSWTAIDAANAERMATRFS